MMAKKISSKFVAGLALTGLFTTTALTVTKAHDLFGSTSVSPVVDQAVAKVNTSNNAYYTTGGPIDATLADEQGIVEMLKKGGKFHKIQQLVKHMKLMRLTFKKLLNKTTSH